jgi:hypothetical protein
MRSKLICSLISGFSLLLLAGTASAETTRLRIAVDTLPLQNKPLEIDAKSAVMPNGAKDHGPIPKTWRKMPENGDQMENARCTDDRRGAVGTIYGTSATVRKIWESNGKSWLDTSEIDTTWGYVEVKHAERVPLALITDGVWGYRRKDVVVLVTAGDTGFIEEGSFYECNIHESEIAAPAGTGAVHSSPQDVENAIHQLAMNMSEPGKPVKRAPPWIGVEFRILASVSKSSADSSPIVSLVVKRP